MIGRRKRLLWIIPVAILGMLAFAALGVEIASQLCSWLLPPHGIARGRELREDDSARGGTVPADARNLGSGPSSGKSKV